MGRLVSDDRLITATNLVAPSFASPEDDGLALVAREGGFEDRYRVWRGRSGRRYLVTVMPLNEAMRVERAVVLLVAIHPGHERHIVWAGESGAPIPGLHLEAGVRLEAHVHLIAVTADERAEAISDLIDGAQGYSSVLTVKAAASHASVGSTTPSRASSRAVFRT